MKFSEIEAVKWPELRPYLDTCLLPVTGLDGGEEPALAAQALENLRDLLDEVEIPFKGRVVTYPAFHYMLDERIFSAAISGLCRRMKASGFAYVIVALAGKAGQFVDAIDGCDLIISDKLADGDPAVQRHRLINARITAMWDQPGQP